MWVGSSSWQDGEAAVRHRVMFERQVTSRLLPDFTHQATDSSGRPASVGHPSGSRAEEPLEGQVERWQMATHKGEGRTFRCRPPEFPFPIRPAGSRIGRSPILSPAV